VISNDNKIQRSEKRCDILYVKNFIRAGKWYGNDDHWKRKGVGRKEKRGCKVSNIGFFHFYFSEGGGNPHKHHRSDKRKGRKHSDSELMQHQPLLYTFLIIYKAYRMVQNGFVMNLKPFHMNIYNSFSVFEPIVVDFWIFRFMGTRVGPHNVLK